MLVAMRGAQYLRSVFVWLDLDFFLWSAVLLDPYVLNDKSADLRARRWCLHVIGQALGVWVVIFFKEFSPHKVGDVSPVRGMRGSRKKHTVVETNWLLLLLNTIVSLKNSYC